MDIMRDFYIKYLIIDNFLYKKLQKLLDMPENDELL